MAGRAVPRMAWAASPSRIERIIIKARRWACWYYFGVVAASSAPYGRNIEIRYVRGAAMAGVRPSARAAVSRVAAHRPELLIGA